MDALSKHIEHKTQVYIPYSIETIDTLSYRVFYLEKMKNELCFTRLKNFPRPHEFKGCINWSEVSYLFYEVDPVEREFLIADDDSLWKATPYEILYTKHIANVPIHLECVSFFKTFPEFFFINEQEVPIVAYLGVGESELNEQILLQNKNEKKGVLGQGYYFTTYENAEYDAFYKEEDADNLVRLENKTHIKDKDIHDTTVSIRDHKFYHRNRYLGDVPNCNESLEYSIYYYDKEVIYLKSSKLHGCKKEVKLRNENGYVMRYVLFLKKHLVGKGKGYDSYAYDSQYMIRHSDHFICLSYHSIKKK